MNYRPLLIVLFVGFFIATSCYYDNYEDLYPDRPGLECDPPPASYSMDIKPWIDNECISCHGPSFPQGGLNLSTFQSVSSNADVILDRIKKPSGDGLLMPQGGPRLPDCTIRGFQAWIDLGKPQN